MKYCRGRIGFLLAIVAGFVLIICVSLSPFELGATSNKQQRLTTSKTIPSFVSSFFNVEEEISNGASHNTLRNEIQDDVKPRRHLLRSLSSSSMNYSSTEEKSSRRRKLAGGYAGLDDPAMGGIILFVIILLFLLCCCRGMLCDLLACVCIYEMCCDDGNIGGFDLMPCP